MTINPADYPHALPDTASQSADGPSPGSHCDELGVPFTDLPHAKP